MEEGFMKNYYYLKDGEVVTDYDLVKAFKISNGKNYDTFVEYMQWYERIIYHNVKKN